MSTKNNSAKFINSLSKNINTKCPGCLENQSNRFAHMIPGGCMSKLESGVEWVQDPEEYNESSEDHEETSSNRPSFSTYSQYADIEDKNEEKKDDNERESEELMFHMDDVEIHVPILDYQDYVNNPYKFTK